jgi:ferrous iron transport protein A
MKTMDLTQTRNNQDVKIIEINGGKQFQAKVESIGLRVGSRVRKLSAQVLNGPITLKVGNTKVAIGRGMAKKIIVNGG